MCHATKLRVVFTRGGNWGVMHLGILCGVILEVEEKPLESPRSRQGARNMKLLLLIGTAVLGTAYSKRGLPVKSFGNANERVLPIRDIQP